MSTEDPALSVELDDGKRYIIRLLDFRASDDRLLRQTIGMTSYQAFIDLQEAMGLDSLAGLVWVMRRRSEPNLTYEEVADSIGLKEAATVRNGDEDDIANERAAYEDRAPEAVDIDPEA